MHHWSNTFFSDMSPVTGYSCDFPTPDGDMQLQEFTGLLDLYGTEIYEGDIVKCGYGIGEVVFQAGCFMVKWLSDPEASLEFLFSRDGTYARKGEEQFEIIGNV